MSKLIKEGKQRNALLVSKNPAGQVRGYTVYSLNKPLLKSAVEFANVFFKNLLQRSPTVINAINKWLAKFGVYLSKKFVGVAGYKFNPVTGRFEKI